MPGDVLKTHNAAEWKRRISPLRCRLNERFAIIRNATIRFENSSLFIDLTFRVNSPQYLFTLETLVAKSMHDVRNNISHGTKY